MIAVYINNWTLIKHSLVTIKTMISLFLLFYSFSKKILEICLSFEFIIIKNRYES